MEKLTQFVKQVEQLKHIKIQIDDFYKIKANIENELPEQVVYQNADGTWTRFTKVDNLDELMEKGQIFRSHPISRFTSKIDILKNEPK